VSDIFLSYAREDREIAERLAAAFVSRGWSVWWDQKLEIGVSFDGPTEQALAQAGCVVVLWSRASVASDWVKAEATEARERDVLLPVLIEDVKPPLEFRRIQRGTLIGWSGDTPHKGFERLVSDVATRLRKPVPPSTPPPPGPVPERSSVPAWAIVMLPTLVAVLLVALLSVWRVATNISLALPVQRVTFTIAEGDASLVRVLDALAFPAIAFERFERVVMEPASVAVADPSQYLLREDRYPDTAWKTLAQRVGSLQFEALEATLLPSLALERLSEAGGSLGVLGPITLPAGSVVTLELGDERGRSVTLRASHPQPALAIPMQGAVLLTAAGTSVMADADVAAAGQTSAWRIDFREGAAPVAVTGRSGEVMTSITLPATPADGILPLFSGGSIPIGVVDFSTQDALGRRVSSVVGDGQLMFLDRPGDPPQAIESSSVVTLGGLRQFSMRRVSVDPKMRSLRMELEGLVDTVTTERGALRIDHRQTALTAAARRPLWVVLGVFAWLFATGAALYRAREAA
jgi:hypothetical protein